jgi:gamma-glutamyltranspeptidase/glutathione hydrolase
MHDFFSARRPSTFAGQAMVATSHPLATAAGLDILSAGGNAVDAALAAVAVQCVVDPLMTGVGGDCFALYAPAGGAVTAMNGSGCAPAGATIAALQALGLTSGIPITSPHAITVPGAVSGWCLLHDTHGRLALDQIFARAIGYATDGYVITPRVAQDWAANVHFIAGDPHAAAVFVPTGHAPQPGDRHAQPLLAERLQEIAAMGAAGFYTGDTAATMVAHLQSLGGLHTVADFAAGKDAAHWVTPISATYRGFEVHECPPNGQGLAALMILRIMAGFDIATMSDVDRIHLHAEATKLAYHHRDALIADAADSVGLAETLLSDAVIHTLQGRIDMAQAMPPALWDEPEHKDTIYLCVVDKDGNAISLINSIFNAFGSTRLDPATGVLFHSRGASFRLTPGHPNAIGPGKRPMHTIIPGMVTQNGRVQMPFGVMGGHYQAAGHAAFLSNLIDRGMSVQAAMDAPRTFATGGVLEVEPSLPDCVRIALAGRGHRIVVVKKPMGGSQAIRITEGLLEGGSDSRKDGMALGY